MRFFTQLPIAVQGYFFTFVTMMIWGSFSLLARISVQWNFQIADILALRFAIASSIIIPILIYQKNYRFLFDYRSIILAIIGSLGYCIFVYSGFYYSPVVHGVILLNGLFPIFAAVLAYIFLKQPFDKHTRISMAIIISTVIVMCSLIAQVGYTYSIGDLFLIASALCWASFSVLLKQWQFTAWQVTSSLAIWSAIIYLPLYFIFFTPQLENVQLPHLAIQSIFQGIVVVIIATLSYAKAVEKIGMFKAGSIANIAPFLAAVVAVPLLNEPLNMVMCFGLIGMAIGALQPWRWLADYQK